MDIILCISKPFIHFSLLVLILSVSWECLSTCLCVHVYRCVQRPEEDVSCKSVNSFLDTIKWEESPKERQCRSGSPMGVSVEGSDPTLQPLPS